MFEDLFSGIGDFIGDNPALVGGLASQIVGTILKARARDKVTSRQSALLRAHQERMRALQAEADAHMAQTIPQFTRPAQDAARANVQAKLEQSLTPAPTTEAEFVPGNPGAPAVVKTELARQMTDAIRKGRQHAKNTAALSAYGDQDVLNGITLNRNSQNVGRVADFARGTSGLLPTQLELAKGAGRGMTTAADIANGLGALGVGYALTRPDPSRISLSRMPELLSRNNGDLFAMRM
jgi:hypothetical protein